MARRKLEDVLAEADAWARRFEDYEPRREDERSVKSARNALKRAAQKRARSEVEVAKAVRQARKEGLSWDKIGDDLGTSGEAARQRYRDVVEA